MQKLSTFERRHGQDLTGFLRFPVGHRIEIFDKISLMLPHLAASRRPTEILGTQERLDNSQIAALLEVHQTL